MTDKKKGGEPEKTGAFIGNGMKKGWNAVKRFGKSAKNGLEKKEI